MQNDTTKQLSYGTYKHDQEIWCVVFDKKTIYHLSKISTEKDCNAILVKKFAHASLQQDNNTAKNIIHSLCTSQGTTRSVQTNGTPFQKQVWEAVQIVPFGTTATYSDIAEKIGKPTAVRAVASAIARNNNALAIPCHRITRKNGDIGEYRWGKETKKKLIEAEQRQKKL